MDTAGTIFQLREGMDVYDVTGDKLGTIDALQFGDEDPLDPGPETNTVPDTIGNDNVPDWFEDIAEALSGDHEMPQEMRARFLRYGYLRIDKGFLQSDSYVTLDKVGMINDEGVHLSVNRADLD